MADHLKIDKAQIDASFERRDFESLNALLTSVPYSSSELIKFYRQRSASRISPKQRLFALKEFWASELPHFHLKSILESDIKVDFLRCYFSENKFCNPELDRHILVIARGDYIRHFKLWMAFNHSNYLASIKQMCASDPELAVVVKELEIIIKAQEKIKEEETRDEGAFLKFKFGDVLLAFVLYFQGFKRTPQVVGNKSLQTKVEMALVDGLNYIISIFKGHTNLTTGFSSNEALQKQFQRNEAPHLHSLIERLIGRKVRKTQIELFLCGYSDFLSIMLNPAILKTNGNYRIFNFNNKKTSPEELYFLDGLDITSRTDVEPGIRNLKFYGIPESVSSADGIIEVKKVLQLLKYFSVYKGPVERMIVPDRGYFVLNQAENKFVQLFGPNEPITLFAPAELIEGISEYFNWTAEEASAILSFLTLDFDNEVFQHHWLHSPFLKLNNHILWLGAFLKDRRWENILLNKLKKEPSYHSLVKVISRNFELRIEEIFKENSFKTRCGEPFRSSNGQVGDFDVLAFKDNYLFVCEAKIGVRSDAFNHATLSEIVKLEGLAAGQLEKAVFNIREDWANIKAKLGIDEAVSLDSVKIVPLIITDFFEGDLHLYQTVIRKITLLELDVILKNRKKELLGFYLVRYPSIAESQNPDINENAGVISDWDLWEGKEVLTAETVLCNIEQNTIWKELETVWKFQDEEYWLEY